MLKFLTHKLRTHSLHDGAGAGASSINKASRRCAAAEDRERSPLEDKDSGTESDDDVDAAMESSEASRSSAATLTPCSPYFLDSALPSDDHHSSEEELEVINAAPDSRAAPEKRKWSQVAALLAVEAASSSDDEVQGLLAAVATPVRFRTWPPLDAHRPPSHRSLSPPPKLFHYAAGGGSSASSPRKRHRHHTPRASHIQRPCLDFEKMQQLKARAVTAWRHGGDHGGELSVFCW